MCDRESDDEISILKEIDTLTEEIMHIDNIISHYAGRKKFLNHRLADLRYTLSQIRMDDSHGV